MSGKLLISGCASVFLKGLRDAGLSITDLENLEIRNKIGDVIGVVIDVSVDDDKWQGELLLPDTKEYADMFGYPAPTTYFSIESDKTPETIPDDSQRFPEWEEIIRRGLNEGQETGTSDNSM